MADLTSTHLPELQKLLSEWKASSLSASNAPTREVTHSTKDLDVILAFRTRPPLPGEATKFGDGQEFCSGVTVQKEKNPGIFVAHVPGKKWSGPTLRHRSFEADLAFGPDVTNQDVYERVIVDHDLLGLLFSGGIISILAYGQTGAGKTYTMQGLEEHIAREIFSFAKGRVSSPDKSVSDEFDIGVTFIELLGNRAVDLADENQPPVAIQEDKVGDVRPNAKFTLVGSSEELKDLIDRALSHRRVSSTHRNAASSRSHAICTIRVKNKLLPYAEEGQLILADLAGSERYEDSKLHGVDQMKQSQENNKSLMNLKECVRAKAKMAVEDGFVHVPWRVNKLTMLLKPIFDYESRQVSKTVIIAHVSPHIQDTVHSVNTLSYAAPFRTSPPKYTGPPVYDPTDPRTWDHDQTMKWLQESFPIPLDWDILCPGQMTALHLAKMTMQEFISTCVKATVDKTPRDRVETVAGGVGGELFTMVLKAKTRKRKEIMQSRKAVEVDEGQKTRVTKIEYKRSDFSDADYEAARAFWGKNWDLGIDFEVKMAKEQNRDAERAREETILGLLRSWKSQTAWNANK